VERPKYTDEQYEIHLKSNDWSKEETNYLIDLAIDFDRRWPVIGDRYEYQPTPLPQETPDAMAMTLPAKPRTTEDLKARYYTVAATSMVLRTPLSSMSSSEFDTHEKMTKYSPGRETTRKKYAEQLLHRTDTEKHEEELLLKELSRIVSNQEKLFLERRALYDRLEAAPVLTASREAYGTSTVYQTSQGLTQLMQTLMNNSRTKDAEKKASRRSLNPNDPDPTSTGDRNRQSITAPQADKRHSLPTNPAHRQLSRSERDRYGVTYPPERLVGGVTFRQERVVKATQAKSQVQMQRITDALGELGIPTRLPMPTSKVVGEYERLIEGVKELLEVRKVREKVEGEVKVWIAQKEIVEGGGQAEEVGREEGGGVRKKEEEEEAEEQEANEAKAAEKAAEANDDDDGEEAPQVDDAEEEDTQLQTRNADNDNDNDNGNENENENEDDDDDDAAPSPASPDNSDEGGDVEMDDADADADGVVGGDDAEAEAADEEEEEEEGDSPAEAADAEEADSPGEEDEDAEAEAEAEVAEEEDEAEEEEGEEEEQDAGLEIGNGDIGEEEGEEGAGAGGEAEVADTATSKRASAVRSARKRSASVVSAVSNKSSKRARK